VGKEESNRLNFSSELRNSERVREKWGKGRLSLWHGPMSEDTLNKSLQKATLHDTMFLNYLWNAVTSLMIAPTLRLIWIDTVLIIIKNNDTCKFSTSNNCTSDKIHSRVRFPAGTGNFSLHHHVQNSSGAHPPSYAMGTRGYFPGGKAAGAWSWTLTSM
jgi:hypothetical protein